jgi:pilus assembly protein CpaB
MDIMIIRLGFFTLMALGLFGFGTVAWISTRPPPPSAAALAAAAKVTVLVAVHPVHAGNLLKPEDITGKTMTWGDAGADGSLDTPDARHALAGAMVRRSLETGDVVQMKDVMRPGDHGFLAAVLGPGMRAVSVGVDAITGTADLIWPGDRVDLILTQAIGDATLPIGRRIAAETVLSDVRVIAIDQQLMQGVAPDGSEGKARTVTMEVTSAQAERVSVATRIGRLSLAVRSADRTLPATPVPAPKTTWASDVSPALGTNVAQGAHSELHVFQGSGDGKEFRF